MLKPFSGEIWPLWQSYGKDLSHAPDYRHGISSHWLISSIPRHWPTYRDSTADNSAGSCCPGYFIAETAHVGAGIRLGITCEVRRLLRFFEVRNTLASVRRTITTR